jgi:hypothetical protein
MSKKQNKTLKLMITALLAIILCLGAAMPVSATQQDHSTGSPEKDAEAAVTKILKMPTGTETPTVNFTFKFEKKSSDGDAPTSTNMPGINDIVIPFPGTGGVVDENGVKTVTQQSGNIFTTNSNAIKGDSFPHAGMYTYKVTELQEMVGYTKAPDTTDEIHLSLAEYELQVIVKNKPDGTGLYIAEVYAKIIKGDDGKDGSGKVDPTPGTPDQGTYSKFAFTNEYSHTNGGGTTNPDKTALEINKVVTGDRGDRTKYFEFSVKVTKPAIGFQNVPFRAYIKDVDNTFVKTGTQNGTPSGTDTTGIYFDFASGADTTILLKHGQKLVFVDLPVGASFEAKEKGTLYYTASYQVTLNNVPGKVFSASNEGDGVGFLSQTDTATKYIGEKTNKAEFINNCTGEPDTGLSVDNMPFIVIIVLVIAGIACYAIIRSRRNARQNG